MKKVKLFTAVLLCMGLMLAAAPVAMGGQVYIAYGEFRYLNGGEFKITGLGDPFKTFCVETTETIKIPGWYDYAISDNVIKGGGGPSGVPLKLGVAWLYSKYHSGVFSVADNLTAGYLQAAIWTAQGYTLPSGWDSNWSTGAGNIFLAQLYSSGIAYDSNANGAYGVHVLNMYDSAGNLKQDQLYVPEPASMLLLGVGLLGAAAVLRRKCQANDV